MRLNAPSTRLTSSRRAGSASQLWSGALAVTLTWRRHGTGLEPANDQSVRVVASTYGQRASTSHAYFVEEGGSFLSMARCSGCAYWIGRLIYLSRHGHAGNSSWRSTSGGHRDLRAIRSFQEGPTTHYGLPRHGAGKMPLLSTKAYRPTA
jgi:hypothetical protein